jgi:hypothetical protein
MRRFGRTYLIALAILVVVAVGATIVVNVSDLLSRPSGQPRPSLAGQAPYDLTYRVDGQPSTILHVDVDARACEVLAKSTLLVSACSLATYLDPSVIATDAHGELNDRDTSALEGIIWRGRLDKRAGDCDDSGLLGDRLVRCRAAVVNPSYSVTDQGLTVSIDAP